MIIEASKRSGIRIIHLIDKNCITEVITNAYGNGFINSKPDCYSDEQWNIIVMRAKEIECKPIE